MEKLDLKPVDKKVAAFAVHTLYHIDSKHGDDLTSADIKLRKALVEYLKDLSIFRAKGNMEILEHYR